MTITEPAFRECESALQRGSGRQAGQGHHSSDDERTETDSDSDSPATTQDGGQRNEAPGEATLLNLMITLLPW